MLQEPPLARLIEHQHELSAHLRVAPYQPLPDLVAGMDVAYPKENLAQAAYVVCERKTGKVVFQQTHRAEVRFPYITGFLAFRELPIILELWEQVQAAGQLAPVVIVDGHGQLHPRQMGIASHLGILCDWTTIGVGKKLPVGSVDLAGITPRETRPIQVGSQVVGKALRPSAGKQLVYLSPGHRIDLPSATELVLELCHGHKLPTPQYMADRLSKQ